MPPPPPTRLLLLPPFPKSSCCKTDEGYLKVIESHPDLADSSKRMYITNLRTLMRWVREEEEEEEKGGETPLLLCDILANCDRYYPTIETRTSASMHTRQNMLATIVTLLSKAGVKDSCRPHYLQWYGRLAEAQRVVTDRVESSLPTARQQRALLSWQNDVVAAFEDQEAQHYGSREHLFLAMLVLVAVRRQEDYARLYVYHDDDDTTDPDTHYAFLDMRGPRPFIQVNQYKTAATHGVWTKDLTDQPRLLRAIEYSLRRQPRRYLFVKHDEAATPYNSVNSFTVTTNAMLRRVFRNPHVTLNSVRHAKALFDRQSNLSYAEERQMAVDAGHNERRHRLYAFKLPSAAPAAAST